MREAMVMRQQRHPNVLPLLAAFLSEAVLWMVMPYVAGGSAIHILNKRFRGVSAPHQHNLMYTNTQSLCFCRLAVHLSCSCCLVPEVSGLCCAACAIVSKQAVPLVLLLTCDCLLTVCPSLHG